VTMVFGIVTHLSREYIVGYVASVTMVTMKVLCQRKKQLKTQIAE